MSRLKGKIALVTGAGRGIGRAIAQKLAQDGALVAVHYGKNRDAAEKEVHGIERNGGAAFAIGAELGSLANVRMLYDRLDSELLQRAGGSLFDILVNNAGIGLMKKIEETSEETLDEVMAINVKAPFFLIQHALPRMKNEGRIINISSATTRIVIPDITAYSVTKGAINTLTLTLAKQLGQRGITINAVLFGFIDTEMQAAALQNPDEVRCGVFRLRPVGTCGRRCRYSRLSCFP